MEFPLGKSECALRMATLFEIGWWSASMRVFRPASISRSNVWEPRENRGRLRHCDGIRTPSPTGRMAGKGEPGLKPEVRIPVGSRSSGLEGTLLSMPIRFSVKEKDEASPPGRFPTGLVECLHIPVLPESEGFFPGLRAGLRTVALVSHEFPGMGVPGNKPSAFGRRLKKDHAYDDSIWDRTGDRLLGFNQSKFGGYLCQPGGGL